MKYDGEQWAEIEGFPGYSVSNYGRVMNTHTHKVLSPRDNSYGYSRVALRKDGRTHERYVHHLVANAFIIGYRPGTMVKHEDDRSNNYVRNLRFGVGKRVGSLNRTPKKPRYRRIRIVETGAIFLTVETCASHVGGDPSAIYRVLRGERESHKGFTFVYDYEER